jgi:hypothetical protein
MIEEEVDTQSERVQSIFTSVIKSLVNDICERYVNEEYDYQDVMFDSAMVMIKEAAQIAAIMGIPKDTYLSTCSEVYDVVSLMMSEVAGSA